MRSKRVTAVLLLMLFVACTTTGREIVRRLHSGQAYSEAHKMISDGAARISVEEFVWDSAPELLQRGLREETLEKLRVAASQNGHAPHRWIVIMRQYGLLGLGADTFFLLLDSEETVVDFAVRHIN